MGQKDKIEKVYLSNPQRYADLWNAILFAGEQVIDWHKLKEETSVLTLKDYQIDIEKIADIVMREEQSGKEFRLFILENQDEIDYSMPVRIMLQEAIAYHNQVIEIKRKNRTLKKKNKGDRQTSGEYMYAFRKADKIMPVHTMVLYWGDKHWDGPRNIKEMMNDDKTSIMDSVPGYSIKIIDISEVKTLDLFKTDLGQVIDLYNKRNDKNAYKKYLSEFNGLDKLDIESLEMLAAMTDSEELVNYLEDRQERRDVTMCKAITELIQEGRQEGRQSTFCKNIIMVLEKEKPISEELKDKICNIKDEEALERLFQKALYMQDIEEINTFLGCECS